jgi:hypothetical protein
VDRVAKQAEYSLDEVLAMLRILEPLDLRAAVAVALAYFAALQPAEIRGLMWQDWRGEELNLKRSVWRSHVGEGKTEESIASVLLIERQGHCSDSLNVRVIAPAMKKAGIAWRGSLSWPAWHQLAGDGYEQECTQLRGPAAARKSIDDLEALHQKDSIAAALKMVEKLATMRRPTESVQ